VLSSKSGDRCYLCKNIASHYVVNRVFERDIYFAVCHHCFVVFIDSGKIHEVSYDEYCVHEVIDL
jgi:hypothetical protein